ncbi:MAG TPA: hypothetical protein DCM05_10665 [Elusimicrobia bacterium]|nr:hypothetical protein [Elusimicrobiota bacterium]
MRVRAASPLAVAVSLLLLLPGVAPVWAADSASLQFTIPAPDPVQAGETLVMQALAVNTGAAAWAAGSYYWEAEIYSLEQEFLWRTKQESSLEAVAAGGVAAVSLPFNVPETAVGRRLYRIKLVKDGQTLLTSEYKPFQIVEKPIPAAPEVVDYRIEGNVTVSFKDQSRDRWRRPSGATTINTVGKIKESSYLFNAYLLHEPGKAVDPYILLLNLYAPWGTIYAGDVSPNLSPLSVSGQSMRGLLFEQRKGGFFWTLGGGQTVSSQEGTQTSNGRYARTLYIGKAAYDLLSSLTASLNVFMSADETGSLGTDPRGTNYRGPTLKPQKNSGYGLSLLWTPLLKTAFQADFEKTNYQAEAGAKGVDDTAWRAEYRMDRSLYKLKTYVMRAGPKFMSFGATSATPDRMTYDLALGFFPVSMYTLNLSANQYKDNLGGDPNRLTTTGTLATMGHVLQFKSGTGVSLNGSMNTAKGQPSTALDNQTLTMGLGLSQSIRSHNVSLGLNQSQFKDKNKIAHDLDTQTVSLSATLALPRNSTGALGLSRSAAKDKVDGSNRTTLSFSPSVSFPMRPRWSGQVWGNMTQSKNTSQAFPADSTSMSLNSEYTWTRNPQNALTLGVGVNKNSDKVATSRTFNELVLSMRYSYSF